MSKMVDLLFSGKLWEDLREHLFRPSMRANEYAVNEQMAFVLVAPNISNRGSRFLARELLLAGRADLSSQSPGGISPTPEFVAQALTRCRSEGWGLVEVHSHPFDTSTRTTFSGIDWGNDRRKMPQLAHALTCHATMVVGRASQDAHYFDPATREILPIRKITVVGRGASKDWNLTRLALTSGTVSDDSVTDERHSRQIPIIGPEIQRALSDLWVCIVGLGGLGSFVALELAYLGVGHIALVDHDSVEESNLNRLIGAGRSDVGRAKVDVFRDLIHAIDCGIRVTAVHGSILDDFALENAKSADLIMGCVDSHGARLALNHLAIRYLIPLIDGGTGASIRSDGSMAGIGGQVQHVAPGLGCLECRGFIDARKASFDLASPDQRAVEVEHGYGTDEIAPSVIHLNGVVASIQVREVLRLLTTASGHEIVIYDGNEPRMYGASSSESGCVTCGDDGVVGVGDLAPLRKSAERNQMTEVGQSDARANTN